MTTVQNRAGAPARTMILPLALAQFIASYAATSTNVAIGSIAKDLGTSVAGVQTAITLFTLTMAALMIPGSFLVSRQDFSISGTVIIPKGSISPVWPFIFIGGLFLAWFFLHIRSAEKKHRDALLALRLFRNRAVNLGLGTQVIQWLIVQGSFFVISVYLQEVDGYNAIKTGLLLTPATIGILAASAAADRLARRHPQRSLIIAGFCLTLVGTALLLALVRAHSGILSWIPGELFIGIGTGIMLTSSVNVVQSAFPDRDQGDISGLSRSLSNLGSSFGTALAGSILVAVKLPAGKPFAVAAAVLGVITLIGLVLAVLIPRQYQEAG